VEDIASHQAKCPHRPTVQMSVCSWESPIYLIESHINTAHTGPDDTASVTAKHVTELTDI
jgi:hypothetical protein